MAGTLIKQLCPELEAISKLTPRIIRILGFNPTFMTLQGTNTYIVGSGSRRILIDTGEYNKPKYLKALNKVIKQENIQFEHIIITHWHYDHIGGLKEVFDKFCKDDETTVWKFRRNDSNNPKSFDSVPLDFLDNEQEIRVEGATLKVFHTPGHTTDHIVLYLKEEEAIFTGDCILGSGTSVFDDLYDYMKSLNIILNLDAKVLYPGHGPVVQDVKRTVEFYIRHRTNREDQIMEVLNKHRGKKLTPTKIVKTIYEDVSEELHKAAENNVVCHLTKLKKEGKIQQISQNEWRLSLN